MSAAGVTVSEEAKAVYEALRADKKHRYVVYTLTDKHVIEAETTGGRSATFADFLEKLRQSYTDQCRWIVYDYSTTGEDGTTMDTKVFINWCPKQANIRQRMIYTSSLDALRKQLVGISTQVEVSSVEEADDAIKAALSR
ncbi:hypothetical protein HPB52_020567 [Rhipicephalus sanguineus]|uniref:ADF-H domain-containing protein n=1 Tax=Rhipicephalus sanguineus TaxID=34632 RepID=A0A9D4PGL5_RHISA|nr:hypothetical protein HPB52_020567 [Rhipicephalus sanguineus]